MSSQPAKGQSKGELKTARTLNTVAIIGATHPMYTAARNLASQAPEGVKAAAGRFVPKKAVSAVRGGVDRVVTRNPGTKAAAKFAAKHGKVAGAAAATGWLGFHGAELAGDVLGRRSINSQLRQKQAQEAGVKKAMTNNHKRMIAGGASSAALGAGVGYFLAPVFETDRANRVKVARTMGRGAFGAKNMKAFERAERAALSAEMKFAPHKAAATMLKKVPSRARWVAGGAAAMGAFGAKSAVAKSIEQSFMSKAETAPVTGHGTSIEKRYYDSEADRQRRIGMATGLLGGTSIVTGAAAANGVKAERGLSEAAGGARRAGVQAGYLIPKGANAKKVLGRKAGLAAVAAASGVGAVASYKRGISRRNQTWQ